MYIYVVGSNDTFTLEAKKGVNLHASKIYVTFPTTKYRQK